MTHNLPLSVQHEVPSFVGPLTTFLLWLAVAMGQFDADGGRWFFPYCVVLLLPPVGRSVWSVMVRRPVVTGPLDQRLFGADILLIAVALLQAGGGMSSPLVLLLYTTACALGLLAGVRKVIPAVFLAATALLLGASRGAIDGDVLGLAAALLGMIGFALVPTALMARLRDEASQARETLRVIEKTARDLDHDSIRRLDPVRKASFAHEDVEADLAALGLRARDWLASTSTTLANGTGADRCLIYRLSGDESTLELQAASHEPIGVARRVNRREGVFAVVFKTQTTLLMSTVSPSYGGLAYIDGGSEIGSLVVVPIPREGSLPWGAIVLDTVEPDCLDKTAQALVEGIAPLLSTLHEQLTDLTALRRGSGEDKMLHDISQALVEQEDTDGLAQVLVERTAQLVEAQAGALAMLQDDSSLLVVRSTGFPVDPTGLRFAFDKTASLVAQSIRYSQIITQTGLGGGRRSAQLFGAEYGESEGFSDVTVLPLVKPGTGGEERVCMGAICLCRDDDRAFAEEETSRAEMLSNQAASHIMNLRLLDETRTQAATDGLTGLPNRRSFVEKLDEMLHRAVRFGTPVSLLIMDVDHFKSVNDSYGHPVGDQVLRRLAALLSNSVREAVDLAARYGGEEFAVLLENTPHDGALKLAERLRTALEEETFLHMEGSQATQFHVTMSIGVASYPEAGDAMVLVGKADQALYDAKESGRNRVVSAHGAS